jgi:UDP-glucose 4-epimerase
MRNVSQAPRRPLHRQQAGRGMVPGGSTARQFGLDWGVLRYGAVLGLWAGPNNSVPGGLMATLLGRGARGGRVRLEEPLHLWSGGEDFVDARDVAAANVAALDAPALPSRVYNISSGRMTTLADFLAAARQVRPDLTFETAPVPATGFANFPWGRDFPFDIGAAARDFGYRPQHDVASSLAFGRSFIEG